MSWHDAEKHCESLGGHLATVTSAEENAFVYENFGTDQVCWLGATDEAEEGKWQWVTGEPFTFQNWGGPREPNNHGKTEHYLVFGNNGVSYGYRFGARWNDHSAHGRYHGVPIAFPVCEWDDPVHTANRLIASGWKASWSADGTRLVCGKGTGLQIVSLESGTTTDLADSGKDPAWSPDGRFIAYVKQTRPGDHKSEEVWLVHPSGESPRKLVDGGFPTWSADGKRLFVHSRKKNEILAFEIDNLNAEPEVYFDRPQSEYPTISPDGKRIAFGKPGALVVVDRETGETVLTCATPGTRGLLPAWSPDGKRIAFGSYGRLGLWVLDVQTQEAVQVTSGWYTMPAWSRDGSKLAFDHRPPRAPNEVWMVQTETLATLKPSRPAPPSPPRLARRPAPPGKVWSAEHGHWHDAPGLSPQPPPRGANAARSQPVRTQTFGEVRRFEGHTDRARSVAFSPDGRRALSGSHDTTIRLWDVESGREIRRLLGHTDMVLSVAFSPDGRYALSGSGRTDNTIRLWDVNSGRELRRFEGHTASVKSVVFSPDGRQALSGSKDRTLRLWDVASGRELRRFNGHTDEVWCVALSPDGRTALSGSWDRTVRLWDVGTGREIRRFAGHTGRVSGVAFSPDGRRALSAGDDHSMRLWEVESGREIRRFEGHRGSIRSEVVPVAFSPDGRYAVSSGADRIVHLWDVETGREIRRFQGHTGDILSVAVSPDGRYALSGSADKTVRLWSLPADNVRTVAGAIPSTRHEPRVMSEVRRFEGHTDEARAVAFSPDGRLALSGSYDRTVRLWDVEDGREIRRFQGHTDSVLSVTFSPDGRYALSGSIDKTIRLWDASSGRELRRFEGHTLSVKSVVFSPDGRQALSGSKDGTMCLWDVASGRELRRFDGHTDEVWCVALSPDGRTALSGSWDRTVRLWDVGTGREIRRFTGHPGRVSGVAFSPDGRRVLSAGDHSIRLWEVESGREIRRFEGHYETIRSTWPRSVAFSSDGRYAVSSGADRIVRLWDVETGREIRQFHGHTGDIWSVAFSPDGRYALSGSRDKTVRLWRVPSVAVRTATAPALATAAPAVPPKPSEAMAVATVLRIRTAHGLLVVEVQDPQVKVTVDAENDEIVIAGAGVNEVRLRPGRYLSNATRDGSGDRTDWVTITRGGKTLVTVRPGDEAPGRVATSEPPPTLTLPRPAVPPTPRRAPAGPQPPVELGQELAIAGPTFHGKQFDLKAQGPATAPAPKELDQRRACMANLKGIGNACHIYANEHDDQFPPDLQTLVRIGAISERQLRCPSGNPDGGAYAYVPGQTNSADPRNVVAYDHPENHGGAGVNVLFADARCEWLTVEAFDKALVETKKRLADPPQQLRRPSSQRAPRPPDILSARIEIGQQLEIAGPPAGAGPGNHTIVGFVIRRASEIGVDRANPAEPTWLATRVCWTTGARRTLATAHRRSSTWGPSTTSR